MQRTEYNKHLFLQIGQCVPPNYFNPPDGPRGKVNEVISFKGLPGAEAIDCVNYIFHRKMGGWVLEEKFFGKL